MTIKDLQHALANTEVVRFALPNGKLIPEYFHVTEMGRKSKHFIDCGKTVREERVITFQIWYAQDYEHRLSVSKFNKIIEMAQPLFEKEDLEIEVEYQLDMSLGIFGLEFRDGIFHLTAKETTCLANNHCGIPVEKMKISLKDLGTTNACCSPEKKGC